MKNNILCLLFSILVAVASCSDDLGNYEYKEVEDPKVTGLVGQYFEAIIGDSLIITPNIQHSLVGTDQLSYEWDIANHIDLKGEFYYGQSLRMLFNLKPDTFSTKFTITNKVNGMKYFYKFHIVGKTEFTTGAAVLSDDNGISRLSFIKGTNTVQPNLYEGLHGENLPNDPKQIIAIDHQWLRAYYILTGEENKPGVILDATTMLKVKALEENFFDPPSTINASAIAPHASPVSVAVFNGKLYSGQWQTCPCSPIYGIYGEPATGDYQLSTNFHFYGSHYIGYDINAKKLIQFDVNLRYQASDYQVIPMEDGPYFDPKNMAVDLIYLKNMDALNTYAFGKDENGVIYEYKFQDAPGFIFPKRYRVFAGSDYVTEDTKWQVDLSRKIFYFTSHDRVYRYNPDNEEVRLLDANFTGKKITMLKLIDENLLMAGVEGGTLHYMDVSTERNGNVYRVIENIPGNPVDVVVRK